MRMELRFTFVIKTARGNGGKLRSEFLPNENGVRGRFRGNGTHGNCRKTSAVSALAIIGNKAEFQEYCQSERRRLGVGGVSSTVADGAPWIGSLAKAVFGPTDECLDIYHAAEHISDCGKVLYRDAEAATAWLERMRMVLLSEGFAGRKTADSRRQTAANASGAGAPLLQTAVCCPPSFLERWASGRVIGSGQVEGACKNLVGRRMKQTGACWTLERANRMLLICSLLYADQWKNAWNTST